MSVTSRYITPEDYNLLEGSLLLDEHHNETPVSFFYEEGTVCSVYEYNGKPVLFARGSSVMFYEKLYLKLDLQFIDNYNIKDNLKAMLFGFPLLAERAKNNGFNSIVFESNVPLLRNFCIKRLGFTEWDGQLLVKVL